jgi:NAD dependent epimerase/dehydratase family
VTKNCEVQTSGPLLVLQDLSSVDWIFHLAGAYAGDWGLKASVKNWVFASAAEVYGEVEGIASEEAPTRPVIPYGRIKLEVERLLAKRLRSAWQPSCNPANWGSLWIRGALGRHIVADVVVRRLAFA